MSARDRQDGAWAQGVAPMVPKIEAELAGSMDLGDHLVVKFDTAPITWADADVVDSHGSSVMEYRWAVLYTPRPRRWWHRLFRLTPRDKLIWSGPIKGRP